MKSVQVYTNLVFKIAFTWLAKTLRASSIQASERVSVTLYLDGSSSQATEAASRGHAALPEQHSHFVLTEPLLLTKPKKSSRREREATYIVARCLPCADGISTGFVPALHHVWLYLFAACGHANALPGQESRTCWRCVCCSLPSLAMLSGSAQPC